MTPDEYRRICDRLARKAIRFATEMAADEDVRGKDVDCPKCKRPAGEPCTFPVWSPGSGHDPPEGFVHNERSCAALDAQREHWIDVFMDERLPGIDADALLDVTIHANAFEKSAGRPAPDRATAALHAYQADVWDAINRMEETADPAEEEIVARGMLSRYRSAKVAMEMAHWHAMDHAEGSSQRARWLRVRETIARLQETS